MQVCCLPWCPGCPVLCVLRAWLLGVCVSLALLCALLSWPACAPVLWGCALPCSLVCAPAMPALRAGLVRGPCAWAYYIISPCYMGLFCGLVFRALYGPLKKGLYFRPDFSAMYFRDFSGLYFCLKISGQIFRASKSGFFRGDFSGENFPDIFPGFIFRHFSWPDFRGGIGLPLFSRCNIHTIPGSP